MAPPTLNPDFQTLGFLNPNNLLEFNQDLAETNRALINISADYDITENLNFRVNGGFRLRSIPQEILLLQRDLVIDTRGITNNG